MTSFLPQRLGDGFEQGVGFAAFFLDGGAGEFAVDGVERGFGAFDGSAVRCVGVREQLNDVALHGAIKAEAAKGFHSNGGGVSE